jgi:hypothetical protein
MSISHYPLISLNDHLPDDINAIVGSYLCSKCEVDSSKIRFTKEYCNLCEMFLCEECGHGCSCNWKKWWNDFEISRARIAYMRISRYVLRYIFSPQECNHKDGEIYCRNYVSWRTVHYIGDKRPWPDYKRFLTCARHVCECHNPDYVNDSIGFCLYCEEKFCRRCGHGCECRPL